MPVMFLLILYWADWPIACIMRVDPVMSTFVNFLYEKDNLQAFQTNEITKQWRVDEFRQEHSSYRDDKRVWAAATRKKLKLMPLLLTLKQRKQLQRLQFTCISASCFCWYCLIVVINRVIFTLSFFSVLILHLKKRQFSQTHSFEFWVLSITS